MTPTLAPTMTQSLTPTQTSASLLGITLVSLILAVIIRRRVPRVAASINNRVNALRGTLGGKSGSRAGAGRGRGGVRDTVADQSRGIDPVGLARAALGWIALGLFAVAGVAASGTFIGTIVLWAAHTAETFSRWLIGLFPLGAHTGASLGFSVVAALALWLGLNLLGDLIEGKAHHGGADLLVFCGPMLFTLVPGVFGQGATWVYTVVATHIGPIVAGLV
jgi:hypothetical protein